MSAIDVHEIISRGGRRRDRAIIAKSLALPMYRLVLDEWNTLLAYIATRLSQIDWEIREEKFRPKVGGLDATLQKLHFWRLHLPRYRIMVANSIDAIFAQHAERPLSGLPTHGTLSTLQDFRNVLQQVEKADQRIEKMIAVASNSIQIEESRLQAAQNNQIAVLTKLASVYIPLSFVASFYSMSWDTDTFKTVAWVFFVTAIPLTLASFMFIVFESRHARAKTAPAVPKEPDESVVTGSISASHPTSGESQWRAKLTNSLRLSISSRLRGPEGGIGSNLKPSPQPTANGRRESDAVAGATV
jgi:hypothetical protein